MRNEGGDAIPTEFRVRRSQRARRARLTIASSGEVTVVLPARASEDHASELFERHRRWVERHRQQIEDRRVRLAMRPSLAAGRPLSVNGDVRFLTAADERARAALERQLRREARNAITERVAARAVEMDAAYGRVTIRDQRTRWGSASRRGTLSFSWRLILAPPEVLDYVVVHELAHLRVAGHSPAFWRLVARHFPDSGTARRWLRDNEHELRHALD